ncbi:MAG: hypothetical protein Q9170_002370 [Blastenia crenularia]
MPKVTLPRRQGLHIIDLDDPYSRPRHLAHHTPWEVADVQWSPFAARDYWVVSTSNQKALVWNLAMTNPQESIEHYLHGHSRAITDINFSAHHPDVLATCAVDSYVHCWDLRRPARAAITFCDWFAGATQVKWNRQDSHILASSHDKFLRIWDDRKGAYPLRSIKAHATKIYGVDWNRTETNKLATCSLDKTIKFWDYSNDGDEPMATIRAPFPVWRARHTPFGAGLLAMPQRGDYDLHLYDRRERDDVQRLDSLPMVHRFDGHEGQVKEFLWRARGSVQDSRDSREFQLISWGADRTLRLHRVDEELLAKVGYVPGQEVQRTIPFTRKDAEYKSFRGEPEANANHVGDSIGERRSLLDLQVNTGMSGASVRKHALGIGAAWATGENPQSFMDRKKGKSGDDVDAISWMRGVKIGKREPLPAGLAVSESSVLSPALKTSQPWDAFDSLAEEITHLADTFTKVTFEEINMHDRRVIVSLHGPFGPGGVSVYIKCRIEVPVGYPNTEPSWATMESTAGVSDETILQVLSDLQLIAYAYQERKRHSLEAILRYLIGEQSRDSTLAWLKAQPNQASFEVDQQMDFTSSDEDDGDGQYATDQWPGLESSDAMIAVSNAQYNVPLPKACGALWADDGRLVCFFPPKEERKASFLDPFSVRASAWTSRSRQNMFEGFSRLQSKSVDSGKTSSSLETTGSGDSDYEDSSRSPSDSQSSSSYGMTSLKLMPSIAWQDEPQEAHRALSIDESQRSSGANAQTTSAVRSSKNFVVIHQCAELLPAKRQLAKDYTLESSTECCLHNTTVARKHGEIDLADTWDFVSLILRDEVPLRQISVTYQHEPILLIARHTLSPLLHRDSAVDLSYDFHDEEVHADMKGPIYWGSHPFGRKWLVDALFAHYEQLADIQMLAMLSCVLQRTTQTIGEMPDDEATEINGRQTFDLNASHPLAVANRYFPSAEVASSVLLPRAAKPSFSLDMQKPPSDPHSAASSVGASISDPLTPFSTGLTPPSSFKISKSKHERTFSQVPLSASPEQLKHTHRSSSNLASAFAASIARPFSLSTPNASSPPTNYPKRRLSPVPSQLGMGNPHSLSTTPSQFNANIRASKSMLPLSDEHRGIESEEDSSFSTRLMNQERFQNDGYAAESLLDPSKEERYSTYRATYASMLFIWELPVTASRVLLFNDPVVGKPVIANYRGETGANSSITIGKTLSSAAAVDLEILRLDVQTPASTYDRKPSVSSSIAFANEQEELGWRDAEEDAEAAESDAWEDVAYESLARNLGGRSLTPKPSQIWRGTRKGSFTGSSKPRRSESG